MHELSIALSIVDLAQEEAERQGGRVCAVHLRLGALAGVVKEALLVVVRDGVRGDAARGIAAGHRGGARRRVLSRAASAGGRSSSVQAFCCAECGTPTPEIRQGRELELVALEIET